MIVGYNTSTPFVHAGNYLSPVASTGVPRVDFPGVGRVRVIYESGYPQSALGSAFESGGKTFYISPLGWSGAGSARGVYGSMTSCATIIDENTLEYGEAFVYTTGTKVSATKVWPSALSVLPYTGSGERNYVVAHLPTLSMMSGNGKKPSALNFNATSQTGSMMMNRNTVSAFVKIPSGSEFSAVGFAGRLTMSGIYWDSRGSHGVMRQFFDAFSYSVQVNTAILNIGSADLRMFAYSPYSEEVRIDNLVVRAEYAGMDGMFERLRGTGYYTASPDMASGLCKIDMQMNDIGYTSGTVAYFCNGCYLSKLPDFCAPNFSGRITYLYYNCYKTPGSVKIACPASSWESVVVDCGELEHIEIDFMHASASGRNAIGWCSGLRSVDVNNFENFSGDFFPTSTSTARANWFPYMTSFCGYTSLKDAIDYWSANCHTASASSNNMFGGWPTAFPDYEECTASPVYSAWTI